MQYNPGEADRITDSRHHALIRQLAIDTVMGGDSKSARTVDCFPPHMASCLRWRVTLLVNDIIHTL